jgi:hypothetical protein
MDLDLTAAKSETATSIVPEGQNERQPVAVRSFDRTDLEETFVDSIAGFIFDGQTLRIEFGVTRYDEMKANSPMTGRRYPACRLVMPPAAAVDLINRIQQMAAAMTKAGVMKTAPRPSIEAGTPAN